MVKKERNFSSGGKEFAWKLCKKYQMLTRFFIATPENNEMINNASYRSDWVDLPLTEVKNVPSCNPPAPEPPLKPEPEIRYIEKASSFGLNIAL